MPAAKIMRKAFFLLSVAFVAGGGRYALSVDRQREGSNRSAVNHVLAATGSSADIGGFPVNMVPSPDHRFLAVTNSGIQEYVTVLDAQTGKIVSRVEFDGQAPKSTKKDGLYFGLCFTKTADGRTLLYVSHGALDRITVHELSADGRLGDAIQAIDDRRPGFIGLRMPNFPAGLALSSDGAKLYAVNNQTFALSDFKGSLSVIDTASGKRVDLIPLPGYPLDIATLTAGPHKDAKVYVTSERDGVVSVVDTKTLKVVKDIHVGANPTHLLLNADQSKLFVSNAGSDTVSVIETDGDEVVQTLNVRPVEQRGLPGATPLGMALSPDEKTLYVALADLDSIGVVDLSKGEPAGLIPIGWYPTGVYSNGTRLIATVGKGQRPANPNTVESYMRNNPGPGKDPRGNMQGVDTGPNIRFNERGLAVTLDLPDAKRLARLTQKAVDNNRFRSIDAYNKPGYFVNPGIKHVIYIVKENRSYDQFFGDFKQGNGDPSLLLYGDDVVPNQRALAKRFVLFDNFYANAEMSADGWSWSTAGIASEFVQRNAQYDYSGHDRNYDYEGQNNGSPVDAMGIRNVNDPPGGYLWDSFLKGHVEFRNYGFYMAEGVPIKTGEHSVIAEDNSIAMKAFEGRAALDFRMFDTDYADSQAWEKHGLTWPHQRKTFGDPPAKSRFEAWNRDYQRLLRENKVPPMMMVRFGNDHTNGTAPGSASPSAMMADNDYAVGQLVETVTNGPLWKDTAIIIVEDDAQGGFDHVDGHRSICFVISPYTRRGVVDSHFYNTDSALRTVQALFGLPASNQFMACASPLRVFGDKLLNAEPYRAILPPKATFTVNTEASYRAADSAKLFSTDHEESASDAQLADILWGDRKGPKVPIPSNAHS
jgi:YVTN family beta-propeller protein